MKTISIEKCPLCHCVDFETFFASHIVKMTSTGHEIRRHEMMACSNCGLVFKKHVKEPSDFCECGAEYHTYDGIKMCLKCNRIGG